MYDVITVGSATLDVFARTGFSELIKIIDPNGEKDFIAYPSGSKILIDKIEFTTGGGGTNSAVALSRLGHRVAFLGKLGKGTNSEYIHKYLKKEKIKLLCAHGDGQAGYSVILDSLEHDRTILTYKGINDDFRVNEVPFKKLRTKWFYLSAMMGESFCTLEKIAEFARQNEIRVAFNPSSYLAEKGIDYLHGIIKGAELVILNREEARMLAGGKPIKELLLEIQKSGPKIVVITDGKNDLYAIDESFIYRAKPPFVKVVDATGAGDAFASSFLSGILKKNNIEFAIRLGIANAISVVKYYGAKNILLSYNQAVKSVKHMKLKIAKKRI